MRRGLAAFTVLALAAPAAHAQLFKCVEGGRTVYQDKPCAETAKQSAVRAPSAGPAPAAAAPADAKAAPAGPAPAAAGVDAVQMVASYTICAERVPNFEFKYSASFGAWKQRNALAFDRLASEPDASRLGERLRQERARPAEESLAERCADVATQLQAPRTQ